ncbi:hypothetical protein ACNQ1M_02075 [Mycoplasma sp. VS424B]|uniref:hypothetical protein n=1 Tax=unclassified Mycoplasma TaxID=2683645 RepID=UPI003AAD5207
MQEIQNKEAHAKAKISLDKAMSKYRKIMLIRALLILPVLMAVFAIISLVKWSTVAGWILLTLCIVTLICYWVYSTFRINPRIKKMEQWLEIYKPYFKEYYFKLSFFNKFIFKYFFIIELYDQEQVNILLNDDKAEQDTNSKEN